MAEGKNPQLNGLEQSLINYLCSQKDIDAKVSGGARRVRSLSFNINIKDPKKAVFTVQIGMCEASFNAANGLKEKGSCFGLERYITDWFQRPSVTSDIKSFINGQNKK